MDFTLSQVEMSFAAMLYVAAAAISAATFGVANLPTLIAAFFIFEICVGMYFPSIGALVRLQVFICMYAHT